MVLLVTLASMDPWQSLGEANSETIKSAKAKRRIILTQLCIMMPFLLTSFVLSMHLLIHLSSLTPNSNVLITLYPPMKHVFAWHMAGVIQQGAIWSMIGPMAMT